MKSFLFGGILALVVMSQVFITPKSTSSGSGEPAGIIVLTTSACAAGYAEVSSLNGQFTLGTTTASGGVGTTGGANNITPAGTNGTPTITWPAGVPTSTTPSFTGNSVTSSAVSAGTPAGTNGASATSGNCAATNIAAGTGSTTACKATAPNLTVSAQTFSGSALGTHTHTTTATGTVGTPVLSWPAGVPTSSSVAFTGTQFDNRPVFTRVIFCQKQ